MVATRIVFGDVRCENGHPSGPLIPKCSIYDVRVGIGIGKINPEAVLPAFQTLADAAPDVRVFNLSFDYPDDLESYTGSYRDAVIRQIADLDNKAFSDDVLVVVAAGNSIPGVLPNEAYPNHIGDPQWKLRGWSRSFNSLTCGGLAVNILPDSVAAEAGAPSPFTRLGPGFARSPKPDLSAHAGNGNATYGFQPGSGHGVWGNADSGLWEDAVGTSFAAPLLAREATRTMSYLQERCVEGSRPFACLVKACLALHARQAKLPSKLKKLSEVSIGYGSVEFEQIETQTPNRAVFLWQGIIPSEDDLVTVEIPVPGDWIKNAELPILRLVAAWDSPVNHAVEDIWLCRQIGITVRPSDGEKALPAKNRHGTSNYTLLGREYHIDKKHSDSDNFLMELKYTHQQMAPYPAGLEFSPQQRIGIAYELFDRGEDPLEPHQHVQSLPVVSSLNRLSNQMPASRQAVSIRTS